MKQIKHIIPVLITLLAMFACTETDKYYSVLKNQPELLKDYAPVYSVNDTMIIGGHFNTDGLQIKIGDAVAAIISIDNSLYNKEYNDSIKVVKLIVSNAMGVGVNRPVSITSSGITVEGPAIEIVEDAGSGLLSGELTVQKIADYPANTTPVYCRSGNGNMYFLNNKTYSISRMTSDGSLQQVFDRSQCRDNDGTAFTYTRFNACGIDPKERYLYLSLYTEAPSRTYWHYYRLCRWDMMNKKFTVLNKTPYYIYNSKHTSSDVQPFEGNITDVKIFASTGIYPDSLGNVYFNMDNRMITRMDAGGNYTYVFKNLFTDFALTDPAPQIVDPETGEKYPEIRNRQFFPGVVIRFIKVEAFAPDENQMYTSSAKVGFSLYDFTNQVLIAQYNKFLANGQKPYISGSFDVLTGQSGSTESQWGLLPLGDGKLLLLHYQNLSSVYNNLPAWGILDFTARRGYRFAPGVFDSHGAKMQTTDQLLNYDADSMLYMTANNKSVILKTVYK